MPNADELTGYHDCDADHVERAAEAYHNETTGGLLTFCRHHGRMYELALRAAGYVLFMMAREPEPAA